MSLPPLDSVPLILRPQAWLHRRHYGQVDGTPEDGTSFYNIVDGE